MKHRLKLYCFYIIAVCTLCLCVYFSLPTYADDTSSEIPQTLTDIKEAWVEDITRNSAKFVVTAVDETLDYKVQWQQYNGTQWDDIPNATTSTYALTNLPSNTSVSVRAKMFVSTTKTIAPDENEYIFYGSLVLWDTDDDGCSDVMPAEIEESMGDSSDEVILRNAIQVLQESPTDSNIYVWNGATNHHDYRAWCKATAVYPNGGLAIPEDEVDAYKTLSTVTTRESISPTLTFTTLIDPNTYIPKIDTIETKTITDNSATINASTKDIIDDLIYEWQMLIDGSWKVIDGETSSTLSLSNLTDDTSYTVKVTITNPLNNEIISKEYTFKTLPKAVSECKCDTTPKPAEPAPVKPAEPTPVKPVEPTPTDQSTQQDNTQRTSTQQLPATSGTNTPIKTPAQELPNTGQHYIFMPIGFVSLCAGCFLVGYLRFKRNQ